MEQLLYVLLMSWYAHSTPYRHVYLDMHLPGGASLGTVMLLLVKRHIPQVHAAVL